MKRQDITGQRFGRLTVLSYQSNCFWLCKCDCGKEKAIRGTDLRLGKTQSCGCLQKEKASKANGKHHDRNTRLYRIWCGIKQRCLNSNAQRYKDYGSRGITVCKEWLNFIPFREWALSHGYADNLTIDRIDNNGNYEPSNCRWVTYKEQFKNMRVSVEFSAHINKSKQTTEAV